MAKKSPPTSDLFGVDEPYMKYLLETMFAPSDKPSLDRSENWKKAYCKGYGDILKKRGDQIMFGKWCIMRGSKEIDAAWEKITKAIKQGELNHAKVSTYNGAMSHGGTHVICVYTPDWRDMDDVLAVREKLRQLGFVEELGYKRDVETENRVYGTADEWFLRM